MWTVSINDGFSEFRYEFIGRNNDGLSNNSIGDVARAILDGTDLKLIGIPFSVKIPLNLRPEGELKLKTRFELLKENE